MKIAVIGDYESPQYRDTLLKVAVIQPDETILDLSRHTKGIWSAKSKSRFTDIEDSSIVVVVPGWDRSIDAKTDITYAQKLHKNCMSEVDGKFIPFGPYSCYQ